MTNELSRYCKSKRRVGFAQLLFNAARHAPHTAARWLTRFREALATLSSNPLRCALAPENDAVEMEIRQLLFGKRRNVFRVLFTIVADEVNVLHIRRATMGNAAPGDLFR